MGGQACHISPGFLLRAEGVRSRRATANLISPFLWRLWAVLAWAWSGKKAFTFMEFHSCSKMKQVETAEHEAFRNIQRMGRWGW
jgi:hypothetical protein